MQGPPVVINDSVAGHSERKTLASIICSNSSATSAQNLWDRLQSHKNQINTPPAYWIEKQYRYVYGLSLLGDTLRDMNRGRAPTYMNVPAHIWETQDRETNQLILDALQCDWGEESRQF